MRDLIILGTGVHGGEMAEIVERINAVQPTWNLLGHIAPKECQPGDAFGGRPVLGPLEALDRYPGAAVVPDNEFPRARLAAVPRDRWISLIDPTAFVSRTARLSVGAVLYPHCFVGLNVTAGDFLFSLAGTVINHDDVIGHRVVFASSVSLAGAVHVEDDCYLGQSSTVRQFLRIGHKSLIGMGAVVTKNVEPFSVMVGNPARKLRENR